jgi:hypothetical protein
VNHKPSSYFFLNLEPSQPPSSICTASLLRASREQGEHQQLLLYLSPLLNHLPIVFPRPR